MKNLLITSLWLLIASSCRKDRVCICEVKTTQKETRVAIQGGLVQTRTDEYSSTNKLSTTRATKKQARSQFSCVNRTEETANTFKGTMNNEQGNLVDATINTITTDSYSCELK